MSEKKNTKENIPSDISDESVLKSQSEKLSRRQKIIKYLLSKDSLMKILLTTETSKKSKHLWPALRPIKKELAKNFSEDDRSFQGADLNELFWVYLNEGTDISVLPKQKKYLPKLKVKLQTKSDGISKSKDMALHHYIALLDHIILNISPYVHDIQSFIKEAKQHAMKAHPEQQEDVYSSRENDIQALHFKKTAKQYFEKLMKEKIEYACTIYDQHWFEQKCKDIADNFTHDDHLELIMFAFWGFHYFKKRDEVYGAFGPEHLESRLSFDLPDYPAEGPFEITLNDFLQVMEQLNFKKHLFDL